PPRAKPELVATGPSQVWTWDATKLKGPDRGAYYDLFVMLDIYSRKAVHWLVVPRGSAALATEFIQDAFRANAGHRPQPLPLHALQAGRPAADRPEHRPLALTAACVQRQSVLGSELQDPEILPGLPRPVRLAGRRPRVLPAVLHLLQHRPPALRHRPAHP